MEFQEFPKIARLNRDIVVTEKIDGTNAQIHIVPLSEAEPLAAYHLAWSSRDSDTGLVMLAGSRSKYLQPARDGVKGGDNFGFAAWVRANVDDLWALGEGRHYGEWWGSGIQRGYGLTNGEKRFSLFNVARWHAVGAEPYVMQGADPRQPPKVSSEAPACCGVVPVLYRGPWTGDAVQACLDLLTEDGSHANAGFRNPEGIVVFHTSSGTLYKVTLVGDEQPKSLALKA